MEEERLQRMEKKLGQCAESMSECSKNMELMQQEFKHQNEKAADRLDHLQDLVETQTLILNGNPKQDTTDRGLIGVVEQLKSTDARKKKYYWITIPVVVAILGGSIWNSILGMGKEDHGRSTETKANKTSPDSGRIPRHDRNH